MRLEDYIARHASERGDRLALTDGTARYTYAQLHRCVQEQATLYGDRRGCAFPFRVEQNAQCVINYLALHQAGCVAVPLGTDLPQEQLDQLSQRLSGDTLDDTIADILFTTGTTGQSKGVMVPHDAILADAENLAQAQQFTPDITYIICGPLNHIGSLSKLYPSLLVGASVHVLEGMKDVNAFFQAVETAPGRVATFMVPATIAMLMALDSARLAACAGKIDFIETGAAAISEGDMRRLCDLLPHSRLYNTYASTETGIIATHDFNHDGCWAGCLGRPMKYSAIEITGEGKVACKGRTIMAGYFQDDDLTSRVLRDGTVYTNDLGVLDDEGRLRLTGRDDDTINVGGYKVAPTQVEAAASEVPGVADCLCIPAQHRVLGTVLKLLVVPTDEATPPTFKAIATHLRTRLESHKVPHLYQYVPHLARTFNGKLNRKVYKE